MFINAYKALLQAESKQQEALITGRTCASITLDLIWLFISLLILVLLVWHACRMHPSSVKTKYVSQTVYVGY